MIKPTYILTTTDYPPRIGGLSTFTLNLEKSFIASKIDYEVLHWKDLRDFFKLRHRSDIIFVHVHPWGSVSQRLAGLGSLPYINFYHGSEVLFQGRTWIKTIAKKLLRPWVLGIFEQAKYNVFISQFTMNQLENVGLVLNYSKDIVFHNCINTESSELINQDAGDELNLICVARDVPHKNLDGCLRFAEMLQQRLIKVKVNLFLTSSRLKSSMIDVVDIRNKNDHEINKLYQISHYNLLLSLDHRQKGFFEGFGLTCLEAGKYGVPSIVFSSGGLPENVHNDVNGIVIDGLSPENIKKIADHFTNKSSYQAMRASTFEHTQSSHGLERLKTLWKLVA